MDGTAKPDNEAVYYAIDTIQTAIHERRAISFQYFEYTPEKEKVLKHKGYRYGFSPYALIWNQDFYYAVGWSEKHGKLAQFWVDRMTAIQDSDAPYISDPSFDPASYIREIFGMYHDVPQRVTLLCENRTMRNIIDHFGEDVDTGVVDTNHFRATVDVAPTPPFFSWVFTFGGAIRIEGPAEVLAKMKNMAAWLHTQSEKYTGLPMAVKPSMPEITTLLYPLAQWMMSRLPLSSLPPTMPTWLSSG